MFLENQPHRRNSVVPSTHPQEKSPLIIPRILHSENLDGSYFHFNVNKKHGITLKNTILIF